MEFICGSNVTDKLYPGQRNFGCQNNGTCVHWEDYGDYCLNCAEGWMHNLIGFGHFYDCSLPVSLVMNFFIFMATMAILDLVAIGFLLYKRAIPHGKTRLMVIMMTGCALSANLSMLSAYLQDGFFEGSLVFMLCIDVIGFTLAPIIASALLRPVAVATRRLAWLKTFIKYYWAFSICGIVIHVSLLVGAIATCRDLHPKQYNAFMLAWLATVCFFMGIHALAVLSVTRRLSQLFSRAMTTRMLASHVSGSLLPRTKSFVDDNRLRLIRAQLRVIALFAILFLCTSILALIPIILWPIYGSVPFSWLALFGFFGTLSLTYPAIVPFIGGHFVQGPSSFATLNNQQQARNPQYQPPQQNDDREMRSASNASTREDENSEGTTTTVFATAGNRSSTKTTTLATINNKRRPSKNRWKRQLEVLYLSKISEEPSSIVQSSAVAPVSTVVDVPISEPSIHNSNGAMIRSISSMSFEQPAMNRNPTLVGRKASF